MAVVIPVTGSPPPGSRGCSPGGGRCWTYGRSPTGVTVMTLASADRTRVVDAAGTHAAFLRGAVIPVVVLAVSFLVRRRPRPVTVR
jgi:hypothetical protein